MSYKEESISKIKIMENKKKVKNEEKKLKEKRENNFKKLGKFVPAFEK